MPSSPRSQHQSQTHRKPLESFLARYAPLVAVLCLLTQLSACVTLSRLIGIDRKRSQVVCDDALLKECEFSNFSSLLDIPKIPADLAGAIATTTKLEAERCALLHKQLISCVRESK